MGKTVIADGVNANAIVEKSKMITDVHVVESLGIYWDTEPSPERL